MNDIKIKICGLTDPKQATECARLGADYIGLVIFPRSPRHVTDNRAAAIVKAVPESVLPMGVFVNSSFSSIMDKARRCGIRGVQLHGGENPSLADRLMKEGLTVFKTLFIGRPPGIEIAGDYQVSGFVVECSVGGLPGGNGLAWNWSQVREINACRPLMLAGGLTPENVADAFSQARPDAVDVSSGVETAPGQKDLGKVEQFIEEVRGIRNDRTIHIACHRL